MTLGELYDALKELEEVETLLTRYRLQDNREHLEKRRDELRDKTLEVYCDREYAGNVGLR